MAKLRIDQLERTLAKPLAPVYLVSGDEALLVQEVCDKIRQHARNQGFSERELYHTDAGFQWDTLFHSANSLSLFSEKKIIEIRIHNGKPGDPGAKALIEYCHSVNEDNILLLVCPKIDKRTQNSKWFKAIENTGDVIIVWPVSAQQLPRWIEQRLAAAGLHAEPQALDILCAKIEGNLLAAVQEIEKLKLLSDSDFIDAKTMADAVTESARYDVFGLVDRALNGDKKEAVSTLQGLRGEGTEPTVILWALSREIRTLSLIKESVEDGKSFDLAARYGGVWENRKSMIRQVVYRLNLKHFHRLIRKCGHCDKIIKGSAKGDVWSVLLDIVLSLSGTESLHPRSSKMSMQIGR